MLIDDLEEGGRIPSVGIEVEDHWRWEREDGTLGFEGRLLGKRREEIGWSEVTVGVCSSRRRWDLSVGGTMPTKTTGRDMSDKDSTSLLLHSLHSILFLQLSFRRSSCCCFGRWIRIETSSCSIPGSNSSNPFWWREVDRALEPSQGQEVLSFVEECDGEVASLELRE